jgi:radical SAM-linked protein
MKIGLEGLEESVLPLVAKPGRYVAPPGLCPSGDFGPTRLRLCVVSPEPLEVAAVNPLLSGLFRELRRLEQTLPPGTFLFDWAAMPEPDLLALLREQDLPPFSLAYRRPLSEFDLLIVLTPALLPLSRALRILSLSGVPVRGEARGHRDPIVVLGGDAAWYPEVTSAFVDAFLLGDAEALIEEVLACFRRFDRSHAERREALFRLSELEGVFVPSFPGRAPGGRWLSQLGPVDEEVLTPLIETSAEGAVLEIARPVGPGCAASAPRSIRFRGVEDAVQEAAWLFEHTGEGELFLTGEGAARHPELGSLLEALNLRFGPEGVQVRVQEVDPAFFTSAVARELQKARRTDLHFAPVAPSERLRAEAGRPLSGASLEESVAMALRGEWAGVRVGMLLGMPGETEDDRREGIELLERLASTRGKTSKRPHLAMLLRPFVPVRLTPWEEHPGVPLEIWSRLVTEWRHRLARSKIRVMAPSGVAERIESALRQGGEPASPFLAEIGTWWESLPPDPEGALQILAERWMELEPRMGAGSTMPAGVSTWRLVGDGSGGAPPARRDSERRTVGAPKSQDEGRRPRREGRPRDVRQSDRFRLRMAKDEPVRFISHLDVTRAFFRAFRQSRLPVAMTGGKERRLKISFGPPLPLGMTSGAEYLDVAFVREVPEPFVASLNESLPEGLTVVASAPMRSEPDSLSSVIQIATYEVSFPDPLIQRFLCDMAFEDLRVRLEDRVASVAASSRLEITKGRGSERKTFNARPSMLRAEVVRDDGGRPVLSLALTLNRPDSARPELWTAALLDWTHIDERLLRVHRSGLYIPGRQSWLDPLDVVAPGFEWWRQPVRGGTVS